MVEMEHKDGAKINAHPSKVESLKNMGWTICGDKPAKKVKPVIEEPKDSEEE